METHGPLRLALAVAPALLAGSLRSLLASDRVAVTIVLTPTTRRFDVAIVLPTCDTEVRADVRIVLDDAAGSLGGGTIVRAGRPARRLEDLPALAGFIEDLATARGHPAARAQR